MRETSRLSPGLCPNADQAVPFLLSFLLFLLFLLSRNLRIATRRHASKAATADVEVLTSAAGLTEPVLARKVLDLGKLPFVGGDERESK